MWELINLIALGGSVRTCWDVFGTFNIFNTLGYLYAHLACCDEYEKESSFFNLASHKK